MRQHRRTPKRADQPVWNQKRDLHHPSQLLTLVLAEKINGISAVAANIHTHILNESQHFGTQVWEALTALEHTRVETSWGVVTMTTPSRSGIDLRIAMGSSPVPGGRSTKQKVKSPPLGGRQQLPDCATFGLAAPHDGCHIPRPKQATERALMPDSVTTGSSQKAAVEFGLLFDSEHCRNTGSMKIGIENAHPFPAFLKAAARLTVAAVLPTPPFPKGSQFCISHTLMPQRWPLPRQACVSVLLQTPFGLFPFVPPRL